MKTGSSQTKNEYNKEQLEFDLELQRMALTDEGKMSASALSEATNGSHFVIASNSGLFPKFKENDAET